MVEFGEELILESFRIPWLIWIQLIVLLLLLVLLYSFSLLGSSSSSPEAADSGFCTPATSSSSSPLHGSHSLKLQQQVGEIQGASARSPGRSRRLNQSGTNHHQDHIHSRSFNGNSESKEGGSSGSMKSQSLYGNNHHPCNIVRLAKIAFLKCLGLDSNSTTSVPDNRPSSTREHPNEKK